MRKGLYQEVGGEAGAAQRSAAQKSDGMAPVGSLRQLLATASCLAVLSFPALISGQGSVQQKGNLLQLCNKNGTTLSTGMDDCMLNEDVVALSDTNTYTVQVCVWGTSRVNH